MFVKKKKMGFSGTFKLLLASDLFENLSLDATGSNHIDHTIFESVFRECATF